MNLSSALKYKNPATWTRGLEPQEIAMVTEEARWLQSKFAKVRSLIVAERFGEAGKEFERLIEALPDDLRRKLGLLYLDAKYD